VAGFYGYGQNETGDFALMPKTKQSKILQNYFLDLIY
jgi:hypothetical protein